MHRDFKSPPECLSEAGAALWASVAEKYELDPHELETLLLACNARDDLARIDDALRGADVVVVGSGGQQRPNPLFMEARAHRALVAALLYRLNLPDESGVGARQLTSSQRGVKAARARWGGV